MPLPVIPTKTALGQEELRRRTGGLGQRHRTILFLIDGRRPLSEVLSLAQQAGAATSHFEDLVRLGYVEMPPEAPAADLPEPPTAPPEAVELTHVELTVPADDSPVTVPEPVSETVLLPPVVPPPAAPVVLLPVPAPAVEDPGPATVPAPWAETEPAIPLIEPSPVVPPPAPPPPPLRSPVAQAVAQLVAEDDDEPLATVRRSLLDTLRLDLTPFSFRAQSRVRDARTAAALISLVWEIERDLSQTRRSRAGLLALQRARELLGLGNTLVDEESQPGRLDDDW